MKKHFRVVATLLVAMFILTSCGSGAKEITVTTSEIFADIQSQVELPVTFENTADNILAYYNIDTTLLDEFTFVEAEDAVKVDTIVLMKVKDAADIEKVKTSLASIIEQKKDTMNNYLPEQYDIACNALLENSGNFIYLVISKDVSTIQEVIETYIK